MDREQQQTEDGARESEPGNGVLKRSLCSILMANPRSKQNA